MIILILNWRDPDNPKSGGAERITVRYTKYWIKKGHHIIWLTNAYPDAKQVEVKDGIEYRRVGPVLSGKLLKDAIFYPMYLLYSVFLTKKIVSRENIDVVIDEIHGLPFFTPLFLKKRHVLLACEVAGVIWDKMYPFPINIIGKFIEKIVYSVVYSKTEIWAISQNTRNNILAINQQAHVKILPLGIDPLTIPKQVTQKKNEFPSAVFVARLVKMKGIELAIEASAIIVQTFPDFVLNVIGFGDDVYLKHLNNLIAEKKLQKNVRLLGFVSEKDKYNFLAKSHFLFHPSYKEGFGLTVLEAGLTRTPAIVKSGSSLDELVRDGEDGFIVDTSQEMAEQFIAAIHSKQYAKLCNNAYKKALNYSWDNQLKASDEITSI
jgi:glycosyltransferase involved in cell wall biosynthesis